MLTRRTLLRGLASSSGLAIGGSSTVLARSTSKSDGHNYPIRMRRKVDILYQSPDGNPNGLEGKPEGLWVGEQITDRAYLLDWETGKISSLPTTRNLRTRAVLPQETVIYSWPRTDLRCYATGSPMTLKKVVA